MLLNHPNIDVNKKNSEENTALMKAILRKETDIAKMLLNHPDIEINEQNINKNTALMLAISN
jgi:ankyrin repeat protein